jgi:monoterpene epsilon-lactone hydrolase
MMSLKSRAPALPRATWTDARYRLMGIELTQRESMPSWQARLASLVLRHTFKPRLARAVTVGDIRAAMSARIGFRLPAEVRITAATLGEVPGEWVEPRSGAAAAALLYVHGGGYVACSARTHRPFTCAFAQSGFRVFAPDYRLAPEHPFPAGLSDVIAAYRALAATAPASAAPVIAGDSAGAGLALAAMLALRDEGGDLPAAAALFSPFADLVETGGSRLFNERRCAMLHGSSISRIANLYLAGADPRVPLASPALGDFAGLPPLLVHVGADETLLDDSRRIAERARAAGVRVELSIWPAVPHIWPLFHRLIPEGRRSLALAADFLHAAAAGATSIPVERR